MAQMTIPADGFTLNSTWSCRVVYTYNSTGSFLSSTCTQSNLTTATNTVRFSVSLPMGAKVKSAKVHAAHTTGLLGGKFLINEAEPDEDGFVTLNDTDFSAGYVDVAFSWKAYTDGSSAHGSEYPTYNGTSSQTVTRSHESPSTVSDVYLLLETTGGTGYIYHAEDGVLVPYSFYRAENGALVLYTLYGIPGEPVTQNLLTSSGEQLQTSAGESFIVLGGM